jgi:hypothetical protein
MLAADVFHVPIWTSLVMIVALIGGSMVLSLVRDRQPAGSH